MPESQRNYWLFGGVVLFLFGPGILMTLWLMGGEDPQRAQMRKDFQGTLEAACNTGNRVQSQAAAKRGKEPPVAEFPFMFLLMIRAVYNSDSGFGSVEAEPQLPVSTILSDGTAPNRANVPRRSACCPTPVAEE